ncbi:MAG: protein-export chaperone SecB, partial [Alphaproteobacteria bacterium]|nr:protein-export chaperone SecB [Alphaproteobacteria bacterium]
MSPTDTPPSNPTPPPQAPAGPLTMHGQYIKDLSFENPRAPQTLIEQKQPQLTLNVTVNTRQFDPRTFEV